MFRIRNVTFIAILIFFSLTFCLKMKQNTNQIKTAIDNVEVATTCLNSMMEAIPAEYCWKKGGDFGVIPYDCPSGYFRSLALCYEYCAPGYRFVAGVCWADCGGGYKDHGMTCYKGIFDWYFKNSYISKSITNFSDLIPCPKGMYRSGALCYKNCQNLGMENCGIGACSSTKEGCLSSIASMAFDTISSVGSAIASVISMGGTAGVKTAAMTAKTTIKNMASKLGKNSMKKIVDNLRKVLQNTNRKILLEQARRHLLKMIGDLKQKGLSLLKSNLNDYALQQVCSGIWNSAADGSLKAPELNIESFASSLDVFNVAGVATSCGDTSNEKGAIDCAKNVLDGLSNFDPLGLFTIASTFMHTTCDIPDQAISPPSEKELAEMKAAAERMEQMKKQECIQVYQGCYYTGESMEICQSMDFPPKFNDFVNSIKVGSKASGVLFEGKGFGGKSFPITPGLQIDCFADIYLAEGYSMRGIMSSVLFKGEDCLILRYVLKKNYSWYYKLEENYVLCPFHDNNYNTSFKLPWKDYQSFEIITYKKNLKATLFSKSYYIGTPWTITGNTRITNADATNKPPIDEIKSFIISLDPPNPEPGSAGSYARYVEIRSGNGPDCYLNISQVVVRNEKLKNIALRKPVWVSSTNGRTSGNTIVDGFEGARDYPNVYHSNNPRGDKLRIDLQANLFIFSIEIYNRKDCCQERIAGAKVVLLDDKEKVVREFTIHQGLNKNEIKLSQ